jgi:hypothetical protein
VVVPNELPRVELVQQLQVRVGAVGRVALAIFSEGEDLLVRLRDAVAACVSAVEVIRGFRHKGSQSMRR